jgi:hypothetical protein
MTLCPHCENVRERNRVYRDQVGEPFVVISRSMPNCSPIPTVVLRDHVGELQPHEMIGALTALKGVGVRRFGSAFYVDYWSDLVDGHWSASARPLRVSSRLDQYGATPTWVALCRQCGCRFEVSECGLKVAPGGVLQILCPRGCLVVSVDVSNRLDLTGDRTGR